MRSRGLAVRGHLLSSLTCLHACKCKLCVCTFSYLQIIWLLLQDHEQKALGCLPINKSPDHKHTQESSVRVLVLGGAVQLSHSGGVWQGCRRTHWSGSDGQPPPRTSTLPEGTSDHGWWIPAEAASSPWNHIYPIC